MEWGLALTYPTEVNKEFLEKNSRLFNNPPTVCEKDQGLSMTDQLDIMKALGHLEGKVEGFLEVLRTNQIQHTDFETRLRSIERSKYYIIGVAAAASFLLQFVKDVLPW